MLALCVLCVYMWKPAKNDHDLLFICIIYVVYAMQANLLTGCMPTIVEYWAVELVLNFYSVFSFRSLRPINDSSNYPEWFFNHMDRYFNCASIDGSTSLKAMNFLVFIWQANWRNSIRIKKIHIKMETETDLTRMPMKLINSKRRNVSSNVSLRSTDETLPFHSVCGREKKTN